MTGHRAKRELRTRLSPGEFGKPFTAKPVPVLQKLSYWQRLLRWLGI